MPEKQQVDATVEAPVQNAEGRGSEEIQCPKCRVIGKKAKILDFEECPECRHWWLLIPPPSSNVRG